MRCNVQGDIDLNCFDFCEIFLLWKNYQYCLDLINEVLKVNTCLYLILNSQIATILEKKITLLQLNTHSDNKCKQVLKGH